jgi:ribosome biogenesis protein Nip4
MIAEPVEIEQWKTIKSQLDADFGSGATKHVIGDLMPVILRRGDDESIYLVPSDWRGLTEMEPTEFEPFSLGLFFGKVLKNKFRPSLSIIDRLNEFTHSKITVSRQGAESFTYGRSIIRESVLDIPEDLKREQRVLILDEKGVCIGLAKLSVDSAKINRLAKDRLVAKNLMDIGWYIRRYG